MKLLKLFSLLTVFALFFVACEKDDDPVTPTPGESSYLPSKTGNFWIYKCVPTDKDSKEKTEGIYHDSTVVLGYELNGTIEKYNYKTFVNYKKEVTTIFPNREYSLYYNDNKIVSGIGYILPTNESLIGLINTFIGTSLPETAIIADFQNTAEWSILDEINVDKEIDYNLGGIDINLTNVKYKITAKKGTAKSITVGSKSVTAEEFIITHKLIVTGKISGNSINNQEILVPIKLYFAKGYGIVAKYVMPVALKIKVALVEIPFNLADGENQHLIKYNVQ